VEVVDTAKVGSLAELRETTLIRNSPKGAWPLSRRYVYTDIEGNRIFLNPRHDGERDGILKVAEADPEKSGASELALPFQFPWPGGVNQGLHLASLGFNVLAPEKPLFQADMLFPWKGKVALSDGDGNMYVYNPVSGAYCLANFREWWNPRRMIHVPEK